MATSNPWSTKDSTSSIGTGAGVYGHAGDVLYDQLNGRYVTVDASGAYTLAVPPEPTPEQLAARDAYEREREILLEEHKEKLAALKTIFPRGYAPIDNFDIMVEVAREDQLNPLYESVLKEFEDAQTALHRAANKLAAAVKLTDSEEVQERAKRMNGTDSQYLGKKMMAGMSSVYASKTGGIGATLSTTHPLIGATGPAGMPGPQGAKGVKGDKGDKGDPGKDGQNFIDWFKGLFK